jgi:hypothetical protein
MGASKGTPRSKLGDDEGDSGAPTDAMIHDVLDTTWYVQQMLRSDHPMSADALGHHVYLPMELHQLHLLSY